MAEGLGRLHTGSSTATAPPHAPRLSLTPPQVERVEAWDSPALSRHAAGPVFGAASLLADGFSSNMEKRGKVRLSVSG